MLGVYKIDAKEYTQLILRGACAVEEKIQNDTFRTFGTDKEFQTVVSSDMLSRVLNAFVHKAQGIFIINVDMSGKRFMSLVFSYVQGMNVLAGPFLFVMSELDAFYSFTMLIQNQCPLYVQPNLEGVHCGVKVCLSLTEAP